jgi:hypothetical protein
MLNRVFLYLGKEVILKKRFFLFSAVIFLPIFTTFTLMYLKSEKLKKMEKTFNFISQRASNTKWQREGQCAFFEKFKKRENFCLPPLNCKKKEAKVLEGVISNPAFANSKNLKKRLEFLKSNILSFKEEEINSNSFLKETIEKQKGEVEVDEKDLERILNLVEGAGEKRPLMVISSFELTKTKNKNFILENMGFIKMEFLEK